MFNKRDPIDTFTDVCVIAIIVTIIILKCIGIITLPWVWLLSPLWGAFLLGIVVCIIIIIVSLVQNKLCSIKEHKGENYEN